MNNDYIDILNLGKQKPVAFVKEILGDDLWEKQKEILKAVRDHPRVAVKSCNSAGKSFTASRLALQALVTHQDSIVLTTAPTGNQVFNVMWREIRGAYSQATINIGGDMLKQSLSLNENWYALGFSTDNPENARGFHAKGGYLLYIVDEASGVSPAILDAIEGTLTSAETRLLYIGNPTIGSGRFYDAFQSEYFHKISIPVWETPNFIASGITSTRDFEFFDSYQELEENVVITHPFLVTPQWAYIRWKEWGEESPMFQSLVEARFPTASEYTLIPLTEIDLAIKKVFEEDEVQPQILSIGVDVARYGADSTVLTALRGYEQIFSKSWQGKDLMHTVGNIIAIFEEIGGRKNFDVIVIDDTGLGGGVSDRLIELGYSIIRVNFGDRESLRTPEKYRNKKAEIFWNVREVFLKRAIKILDEGKMIRHLSAIEYRYESNGRLYILSKDEMRKKGMESTDYADSLALALEGLISYNQTNIPIQVKKSKTLAGNLYNKQL